MRMITTHIKDGGVTLNLSDPLVLGHQSSLFVKSAAVCMYLCMYVCMYGMYVCVYVCMCVCVYVCMCVCVYVCMCVCMYVKLYLMTLALSTAIVDFHKRCH
jgi:hypothetical protein